MAKIVNLNKFRKQKLKVEADKRANTNRRLHGRTKAEREGERLKQQKLDATLDGARLDDQKDED